MKLAWGAYLSVGNDLIDSDHKKLIVAVNNVAHAIETRDRAALSEAYKFLNNLLSIHFTNEEKIAKAANIPFDTNDLCHLQLMDEINYMINKLDNLQSIWPDHVVKMYSRFLNEWVIKHIVEDDMKMKPVLETYPYNFISN
ncbi:MAG: hypothetical protein HY935_02550 [Nitrosomonadales bacterium]|nr:hypothetical protein [Nitrosomonadales bacterium]